MRLEYRADLDGLRAIAVIAVVLFHLGIPVAPGGFVGVDVFFVLSGYFITRQIAGDLAAGRFSIVGFYDRRIRRLFPALFFMLTVSTVVAFLLFTPGDFARFGKSLAAAALSLSNVFFWLQTDYFSPSIDTMPLLHTWSLAVEEQFYVLFPLLLLAFYRLSGGKSLLWMIQLLTMVSFAASILGTWLAPNAAFYMLPFRAWELSIGSLLALSPGIAPRHQFLRSGASLAGLAGIVLAATLYTTDSPFPGLAAALPCGGSALLIWAGMPSSSWGCGEERRPIALRLLSMPLMVFIGLISYSLYLWHWPVIVLGRYAEPLGLHTDSAAFLGPVSVALAIFSWRFIEKPLRSGDIVWTRLSLRMTYGALAIACGAAAGISISANAGFPSLYEPAVLTALADAKNISPLRDKCHIGKLRQATAGLPDACSFGSSGSPSLLMLADSHGAEISYALGEKADQIGFRFTQITASSCPPAMDLEVPEYRHCTRFMRRILEDLTHIPPATILVSAAYSIWTSSRQSEEFWSGFERVIAALAGHGHNVLILGGAPPHYASDVPSALAKRIMYGIDDGPYRFAFDAAMAADIDARLQAIAAAYAAAYIPVLRFVCEGEQFCRGTMEEHALYFDRHHFSLTAARAIARTLILPRLPLAKSGAGAASRAAPPTTSAIGGARTASPPPP